MKDNNSLAKTQAEAVVIFQRDGKPVVRLTGIVRKKADEMNIGNIQISISHSRNLISTLVVVEENV